MGYLTQKEIQRRLKNVQNEYNAFDYDDDSILRYSLLIMYDEKKKKYTLSKENTVKRVPIRFKLNDKTSKFRREILRDERQQIIKLDFINLFKSVLITYFYGIAYD